MSLVSTEPSTRASSIIMYATRWCGDCRRAKRWFDAHHLSYEVIDIDRDQAAAAYVMQVNQGMRSVPTIVFPDGSVLVEPTVRELDAWWHRVFARPGEEKLNGMNQGKQPASISKAISHPRFATYYNRLMNRPFVRHGFDPWRRETAGETSGVVLEVGAGGGQNFPFYDPARVARVEAIEPDEAMLAEARQSIGRSRVPLSLSRARIEDLPFPDAHFDSAVATLVFCSVDDPARGLREIWRVLKPGGQLFLLEHVRAKGAVAARIQKMLVPVTTRCLGNCHWDRETAAMVATTGFQFRQVEQKVGGLQPILLIQAARPKSGDEPSQEETHEN